MNPTPIRLNPTVVVLGDSLLDHEWHGTADRLCPDSAGPVIDLSSTRTRAGGAALAALAAAGTGARTFFVTALGDDEAGHDVRNRLLEANVEVVDLGLDGPTPEKIRLHVHRLVVARLDRGCATVAECGPWSAQAE